MSDLTLVLEKIFVLLNKFLRPQPAIFVEEVDLGDLVRVSPKSITMLLIDHEEQGCIYEWEQVPQCSESDIGSDDIVIVSIKSLCC